MNGTGVEAKQSRIVILIGVVVIVGVLHIAREIFVPIALAILLSFLLAPLAKRLMKWKLPNVMAVLVTVGLAFSVLAVVGWLVSAQFVNLVEKLPYYQENMRSKISSVMQPQDGAFDRAGKVIGSLKKEIEEAGENEELGEKAPILVKIKKPEVGPLELLGQYAAPILGPLGTAGITAVFVMFMLLQRNDLRDRLVKLASGGNLNLATQAVDDATQRITRYLLMQMVVNVTYGFPLGIGLYFIGVPNALLWGLLATLLRFIPFVGPWIAAFFPLSLAIAVDPGWSMPLMVIGLVVVLELISNNAVEPWLYGSSTGISVMALLVAALVWTWIWGPVGLFLSTPLTVCLLVIGRNVPSFSYLNVILGADPVLSLEARLYQRMLARDQESMIDLADEYLKTKELPEFYGQVLIPALSMAEVDRHAGTLAENRQQFIVQSTAELIEDLGERYFDEDETLEASIAELPVQVICIPAQDEADWLTALVLTQLLNHEGIQTRTLSLDQSVADIVEEVERKRAEIICICALPPGAMTGARRKCRQLRRSGLRVKQMTGIWDTTQSATGIEKRLANHLPDLVATTMADALRQIATTVERIDTPMVAAPIPENEAERLEEVRKLNILDTPPEEVYDLITRKLAENFKVPISLVTIVDSDRQFWKSQVGLTDDLAAARESPRISSVCGHVVAQDEVLVVEDLAKDKRFANNPEVKERGIRFYAGAPLRTKNGHVVGSLCVIDTKPQTVNEEQKLLLQVLADQLMKHMQEEERKEE